MFLFLNAYCTADTHPEYIFFHKKKMYKREFIVEKDIYMKIHYMTLIYDYVHFWYFEFSGKQLN